MGKGGAARMRHASKPHRENVNILARELQETGGNGEENSPEGKKTPTQKVWGSLRPREY